MRMLSIEIWLTYLVIFTGENSSHIVILKEGIPEVESVFALIKITKEVNKITKIVKIIELEFTFHCSFHFESSPNILSLGQCFQTWYCC